jgi:hypothetical protein
MKTLLRSLILVNIVLWLGGVMFFPVVAAAAFSSLSDTHAAGTIVARCLRTLHYEGLLAGTLLVVLLVVASIFRTHSRSLAAPILLALVMLGLTGYSQFSVIPRMEQYRLQAGGAIDTTHVADPNTAAFNQLHHTSEHVEEGVLVGGLLFLFCLAWADVPRRAV